MSAGILAFVEGRTGRDARDETAAAASETAKETAAWPIRARWQRSTCRSIESKVDQTETMIRVALSERSRSCDSHIAV